jgi:hypothetical protein
MGGMQVVHFETNADHLKLLALGRGETALSAHDHEFSIVELNKICVGR